MVVGGDERGSGSGDPGGLPVALALVDEEQRVRTANRAFAALAGVAPEALAGRRIAELLPDLAARLGGLPSMVQESSQPFLDLEIFQGGRRRLVSLFPAPGGICLSIREPPAARAPTASEREPIFHSVFEHAPVGMLVVDWSGGGGWSNQAMRDMLGYSAEELAALGVRGITHPDDFERDLSEFQKLMTGESGYYQIDKRYLRKDGEVVWGRLFVSVARDDTPHLLIAMIENITEMRYAAEEREEVIRALEEALRAREVFLSIASHELNTPLTPLKLRLQALRRRTGPGELDEAIRQVDRLVSLVDKLLDVSRLASGRLELERERLDLVELARETLARFRAEAERAGSTLVLHAGGEVAVLGDRLRLEQVVANLLTNALKFGAGAPVEVSVSREGAVARLGVRDHGIGIEKREQARIFGRFERAVSELRYAGLGLGLFICREITEAHGGHIHVESEPHAGAAFVVELPAA